MSGRSWNTIGMNRGGKTLSQNKLFVIVFVWEYDHTQESNTHTNTHVYIKLYICICENLSTQCIQFIIPIVTVYIYL